MVFSKEFNTKELVFTAEMIAATQDVVIAAMKRLEKGYFDSVGNLVITLKDPVYSRIYRLVNFYAQQTGRWPHRKVESYGSMDNGLWIRGIQLEQNCTPIRALTSVELPRDPSRVSFNGIRQIRSADSISMLQLAVGLYRAAPCPEDYWERSIMKLSKSTRG